MSDLFSNQLNPLLRSAGTAEGLASDIFIPPQGQTVPNPRSVGQRYRLGSPIRPNTISWDHGFFDRYPARAANAIDRAALAKWKLVLATAEKLRPDLLDATQAYRHFLYGNGADSTFDYNRYVLNDSSGRITLASAISDFKKGAEAIYQCNVGNEFYITSDQIHCDGRLANFPSPKSENWQKTIGGHIIWLSGKLNVIEKNGEIWLKLLVTLHAEDRYNFNPYQKDIATGILDEENGRFSLTGLAHQFTHFSEIQRMLNWKIGTNHRVIQQTGVSHPRV